MLPDSNFNWLLDVFFRLLFQVLFLDDKIGFLSQSGFLEAFTYDRWEFRFFPIHGWRLRFLKQLAMRLSHYFFNIFLFFFFHFNNRLVAEKPSVRLNFLVQELSCLLTWDVATSRSHTKVQCHVPFLSNLFFCVFSHNRWCNRFFTFVMRKPTTRLLSLKHCEATPKSYICMAPLLGHYPT